jgi:hypothetical protein
VSNSRGRNAAPQIEFFFAPAYKSLALAPDLIGLYFGYFFFLGKEKEKVSPSRNKSPREQPKRYRWKGQKKSQNGVDQKSPMTILG